MSLYSFRLVCAQLIGLWGSVLLAATEIPRELNLNTGWRFHRGEAWGAESTDFEDSNWDPVILPHDWSIAGPVDAAAPAAGHGGYFPTGAGWYRLKLPAPKSWGGKCVEIEFEGAAMGARVWLNGAELGSWAYGYTPFHFDLSKQLKIGEENVLTVRVDNSAQPNSRWYSGSGLYRPVRLRITDPVRVPAGGVWVTTQALTPKNAQLNVHGELANSSPVAAEVTIEIQILDSVNRIIGHAHKKATVAAHDNWTGIFDVTVYNPRSWSPESPNLNRVITQVRGNDGGILDETSTSFGIRTVRVSSDRGFELNGGPIKLLGGNVHHDTGLLGAAAFYRAEERKVELLKAAGFNAVRTAHNPPSTSFLEACDRLGLLVVDEIFDGWEKAKNKSDYSVFFADWWRKDVEAWIRRDRHHPSIIMWSTGNEMFERGNEQGRRIVRQLSERIRMLDVTRPITAGVNGLGVLDKWPQLDDLFASLDVAGYNYELQHAPVDHERMPQRVIMASESYQTEAFSNWSMMTAHPYIIGDFVWSSLDYLGEAGIGRVYAPGQEAKKHWEAEMFPWHGASCGDMDLTGWRKPVSYYREIIWDRGKKLYAAIHTPTPEIGEWRLTPWSVAPMLPTWTWPGQEQRPLKVEVYSRYDAVRLELNGRILGEKPTTQREEFKAVFEVHYAPGKLKIIGLNAGRTAEIIALQTASGTAKLQLTVDRAKLRADGQDLAYITIEAIDKNGEWQPHATPRVIVRVEGMGSLVALGSGDMTANESYTEKAQKLYQGRALAIVRAEELPGKITLTVNTPGLPTAKLTLKTFRP